MGTSISIIIPYYNGERFYPALLQSIRRAILESSGLNLDFQVITIIDSIETSYSYLNNITYSILNDLNNVDICVNKNINNAGVAKSRNIAISLATGQFIHIIDQDDLIEKGIYLHSFPLLELYNFILVNGKLLFSNKLYNTSFIYYFPPTLSLKELILNDFIRSPGQVIFSSFLCRNVLFPEPKSFKGADDRFFWIRLFSENRNVIRPIYVKKCLYIANIHEDNYGNDSQNLKRSSLELWDLILKNTEFNNYISLVNKDILRLKYSLSYKLSPIQKILGFWQKWIYLVDPNKIMQFVFKYFISFKYRD